MAGSHIRGYVGHQSWHLGKKSLILSNGDLSREEMASHTPLMV